MSENDLRYRGAKLLRAEKDDTLQTLFFWFFGGFETLDYWIFGFLELWIIGLLDYCLYIVTHSPKNQKSKVPKLQKPINQSSNTPKTNFGNFKKPKIKSSNKPINKCSKKPKTNKPKFPNRQIPNFKFQ